VRQYLRLATVPAFLFICLILGGASAAGLWANLLLQLIGILIIGWALIAQRRTPMSAAGRQLFALVIAMLLVILVQLIPLPPAIWTLFPGREQVAEGYRLLGLPLPWLPVSLTPHLTLASALWLLPALAVLLGIVKLGSFKASWIAWVIIIVAAMSVAVGALQLSSGDQSGWRFYRVTNYGAATGFFANANHLATLLLVTIPFLAALYAGARRGSRSAQRASGLLVIVLGALAVVLVGLGINASLAGVGLAVPVVGASLLMVRSRKKKLPIWSAPAVAVLAAAALYVVFSAPLGNNLTGENARANPGSRYTSFTYSIEAAKDFMPLGSGIGSFVNIYRTYENQAAITRTYMNHVHGDYIELALETGVVGLAVLLIFLLWWGRRVVAIWRSEEVDQFARAATVASAAILAHSAVDYPLRTAAISAIFAACIALMAEPRARTGRSEAAEPEKKARHLSAD
jgi:O-antigen ligase